MRLLQQALLIDQMARLSLRGDASRYFLGYLWWILEPLAYVAVFYLVFEVVLGAGRADFLLFLMCGKLPFMWFSGSVNSSATAIYSARGLIGQARLPQVIFPLARVQEALYRQLTVFALLLLFVAARGHEPGAHWLWLLPLAFVQYLLIVACATLAALLVAFAQDFQRLVQLGTLFLLFVSGIFWDVRAIPSAGTQAWILALNPLAFLLDGYRQVLMYGAAPDAVHLGVLGLGSLLACLAVFRLLARLQQVLALRVLTL